NRPKVGGSARPGLRDGGDQVSPILIFLPVVTLTAFSTPKEHLPCPSDGSNTALPSSSCWDNRAPADGHSPDGGAKWHEIGAPPPWLYTAFYDLNTDWMIFIGGWDGLPRSDIWALSLEHGGWLRVEAAGEEPPGRSLHAIAFDSIHRRALVFGGTNSNTPLGYPPSLPSDVWELSLSPEPKWRKLEPLGAGPSPRRGATAVYDSNENRLLVFGGLDSIGLRNDIWSLTLGVDPKWEEIHPLGKPPRSR